MSAEDFDKLVSVLVEEQARREELEAENAALRAELDDCQGGGGQPSDDIGTGYYQQGTDVDAIYTPQEQRWGRTFEHILCFTPDASWDDIAVQQWWAQSFGAQSSRWAAGRGTVISLPLCPQTVPDVTSIDPDDIWDAFGRAGRNLVAAGLGAAILRIGWESQGSWYNWSSIEHPGTYKARFRDAVNALRQAEGQSFLIDWNIAGGKPVDLDAFDPSVVDIVSIDLYDSGDLTRDQIRQTRAAVVEYASQRAALDESWGIAQEYGKGWAVAEWGLWNSDHPEYVEQMTSYLDEHPHAHEAYFDVSSSADHQLAHFPRSEQVYAEWRPTRP